MTKDTAINLLGWTAVAVAVPFIIVAAIIASAFEVAFSAGEAIAGFVIAIFSKRPSKGAKQ